MAKDPKHKSALHEMEGVEPPKSLDGRTIKKIKLSRNKRLNTQDLVKGILNKNRTFLEAYHQKCKKWRIIIYRP